MQDTNRGVCQAPCDNFGCVGPLNELGHTHRKHAEELQWNDGWNYDEPYYSEVVARGKSRGHKKLTFILIYVILLHSVRVR